MYGNCDSIKRMTYNTTIDKIAVFAFRELVKGKKNNEFRKHD